MTKALPAGYNAGDTVYCYFDSYDSNGASVTITGLSVTDVEIYKDGSITQRASDNGIALLDSDGIDFDGVVGIHGFSIDTSDNSDAGFWADGSHYLIVVDAITVDSQTVRFSYELRLGVLIRPSTDGRKIGVNASGHVERVTLVDTTTTNTDMRGTDDALLAASAPSNFGSMNISGTGFVGINWGAIDNKTASVNLASTTIAACVTNNDMRGTDNAATAANLATAQTDIDAILVDTGTTIPASIDALPTAAENRAEMDSNSTQLAAIRNDTESSIPSDLTSLAGDLNTLLTRMGTPVSLGSGGDLATNLRDMAGATFVTGTDSQEAIRNHIGDGTNLTEAGGTGDHLTAIVVDSFAAQAKADVNAEVLDVLNVDTFALPGQDSPPATTSVINMIRYLYKGWRNKKRQATNEFQLFNDAGDTVDQKSTLSDDGAGNIGKIESGP